MDSLMMAPEPAAAAIAAQAPIEAEPAATSAASEAAPQPAPTPAAPAALISDAATAPVAMPSAAVEASPAAAEPASAPSYAWQPFTLPEGFSRSQLDQKRIGALHDAVIAADLSPQDRAQRLLDMHIAEMRAYDEATLQRQWKAFEERQAGWRDQFKGDQEIGGAGAQTSLDLANAAIQRFASENRRFGEPLGAAQNGEARQSDHGAFMQALRETGMINHPEMVRFLARIEKTLRRPAQPSRAKAPAAEPAGQEAPRPRDIMYDHPKSLKTRR